MFTTVQSIKPRINTCSVISITWFIFNLHLRKYILLYEQTRIVKYCIWSPQNLIKNNPHTWNCSSLHIVANFHPCWPHAQSPLPLWGPIPGFHYSPSPFFPLFPPILYMQSYDTDDMYMSKSSSVGHSIRFFWQIFTHVMYLLQLREHRRTLHFDILLESCGRHTLYTALKLIMCKIYSTAVNPSSHSP